MSSESPSLAYHSKFFALQLLAFVFVWAAVLFGTLQLLLVPMPAIHSLCGPGG